MNNGVAIILFDKNKKILLQHRDNNASVFPNKWGFFGGRIEKEETPLDAVKRECMEELGYKLENPKLILKKNVDEREFHIFIEKFNPSKKLTLKEGNGMSWFEIKDLKKINMTPISEEVLEKIKNSVNGQS